MPLAKRLFVANKREKRARTRHTMEKKLGMVRTEGHREHGWLSQMQCTTSMLVMKHERSIQKYQKIRVIFFEQFIWMFVCCSECPVAGWLLGWLSCDYDATNVCACVSVVPRQKAKTNALLRHFIIRNGLAMCRFQLC